ncbi:MAG: 2OG-Fe(II) oxygenase family protein [Burkholderiaceae bacterium]
MVNEVRRWLESSDVIPMFPSLVWKLQIDAGLRDALAESIFAALTEMRRGLPPLEPGRGWQSAQSLHERSDFRELVSCVDHGTTSILRFLRIGHDGFEIAACWATVLAQGATHKIHSHPNNFLSGVYYVRTQPGADTISFHDPRRQTSIIRPPVVQLTADNTDQVVLKVCNGTLQMFPSFLEHSVDANMSAEERVSISFNLMFSSFTQQLSKPLW